jgi:hypothetical protein
MAEGEQKLAAYAAALRDAQDKLQTESEVRAERQDQVRAYAEQISQLQTALEAERRARAQADECEDPSR